MPSDDIFYGLDFDAVVLNFNYYVNDAHDVDRHVDDDADNLDGRDDDHGPDDQHKRHDDRGDHDDTDNVNGDDDSPGHDGKHDHGAGDHSRLWNDLYDTESYYFQRYAHVNGYHHYDHSTDH